MFPAFTLQVSAAHIARAARLGITLTPIELAVAEQTPFIMAILYGSDLKLVDCAGNAHLFRAPAELGAFVDRFRQRLEVEPATFRLELVTGQSGGAPNGALPA
jgi:hypothetical protein